MLSGPRLVLPLLWATLDTASFLGQACLCTILQPAGLRVNCTSNDLLDLPHLPSDTTELLVQGNGITTIPSGLFDNLLSLHSISLTGNPLHCDCSIEYLRNWLLRNRAAFSQEPTCFSPSSVTQKPITELTNDYFIQCGPRGFSSSTFVIVMILMLCCIIVLLLWSLSLAKNCSFTLKIEEKHMGLKANSLSPLRGRQRTRLSSLNDPFYLHTEDLNRHPANLAKRKQC
ncbi:platelet glycoprotein IX isoform X2 [Stigmatopora argus]